MMTIKANDQWLRKQLPRRVRLRLWRDRRIDAMADWLIRHKHVRLAVLLWKAFGLW